MPKRHDVRQVGKPTARWGAFTLIELLVVVAIIVILVAILVPALSQAIYASKYAACGAHQHGIANGMNTYAFNNKQRFPIRYAVEQYIGVYSKSTGEWAAKWIFQQGALKFEQKSGPYIEEDGEDTRPAPTDDRPNYAEYMGLDLFEDPMSERGNLDHPTTYQTGRSVLASIDLWWDIQFVGGTRTSTIRDSISWRNTLTGVKQSVPLLAGDRSIYRHNWDGAGNGFYFSSHPDLEARLPNVVWQDFDDTISWDWASTYSNLDSGYWNITKAQNTHFDRNYAFTDGSVHNYRNVDMRFKNFGTRTYEDERMNFYPGFPGSNDVEELGMLPKR